MIKSLDQLCINTVRFLSADAVQKANSGHPGLPMGAAPMAYVLWTRFLKHNPINPTWFDRDRFVLSGGHGSMLLYSLLHLTGYDLPMEELVQFRQWGSRTPGHPERGHTPGVEATTGPLGQGFANAVGLAIAERFLASRYNRPGHSVIDHYTYCLVSDGDLMEGLSAEAAALAGHLRLGKLICLYDDNRISLAGSTGLCFTEDRAQRFRSQGWHTVTVEDGNDLAAIETSLHAAQEEADRPSLILVRTTIGYGAPNKQGSFEAHGAPLGAEEVTAAKENLGWPVEPPFYVPHDALDHFRQAVDKGQRAEDEWRRSIASYAAAYPDLAEELQQIMRDELPSGWQADVPVFPADAKGIATRVASARILNAIAQRVPNMIGGSADLNPSTQTVIKDGGDFQHPSTAVGDLQGAVGGGWSYAGRNVHFGVREHAMGSISTGIAVHGGLIPFTGTFFTFADYMRPAMRLAAVMSAHVIFVFSHDSVAVGEDGPTHQPVEHLASLRAIPGLVTIRPCDANEVSVAWAVAMESKGPVALVLTRQAVPVLDRSIAALAEGLRQGAYVLSDPPEGRPDLILIASGSEVHLIVAAQHVLRAEGIAARTVSMPSWELFDAQPKDYRDAVLLPSVPARLAVEAGVSQGWHKYVGGGSVVCLDHFGASAPGSVLLAQFGFTVDHVVERAKALLSDLSDCRR